MRKPTQQQTIQRAEASSQHTSNSSSRGWSSDGLNQQAQDRQEVRVQSQQLSQEPAALAGATVRLAARGAAVVAGAPGKTDRNTDTSLLFCTYKLSTYNRGPQGRLDVAFGS
jgi:hypothetical protein